MRIAVDRPGHLSLRRGIGRRELALLLIWGLSWSLSGGAHSFGQTLPVAGERDPRFVGRDSCVPCHRDQVLRWTGSDHDRAMDRATPETVLGDFEGSVFEHFGVTNRFYRRDGRYFVHTEGPEGRLAEFEVTHTFGFEPLQQYLVPFPGGRLQALPIAWDVEAGRWFHLYPEEEVTPDDWLHWTRGGQNWNGMCAECHSTNLQKGYDPARDRFETTWAEIDVSCEACHGPGSVHVAWAEDRANGSASATGDSAVAGRGLLFDMRLMSATERVEICAPCHSRRHELGDYDHRGGPLLDTLKPALLEEGLYHADGQILDEVYVYGSFLQSRMHAEQVDCVECHDPHGLELRAERDALCLRCHEADSYATVTHHRHSPGEGGPSRGARCVACHMPERPYMGIDWRADHSFRPPRPDLTLEMGTPNACAQVGCHAEQAAEWAAAHFRDWYGARPRPHYGRVIGAGRSDPMAAAGDLIALARDVAVPGIVRATAISLLRGVEGEASLRAIVSALDDPDPLIRYTSIEAMDGRAANVQFEALLPLLEDPVRTVRARAAFSLSAFEPLAIDTSRRVALDAATAEYVASMERSLDFAHAAHNLGNLFANLGQIERARASYERALEVDSDFQPSRLNLALLLARHGDTAPAIELLREVRSADPDRSDVALALGLLLAEDERPMEALELLDEAAAGMPQVARIHYNRGLLLEGLGRETEAERAFQRAVEAAPTDPDMLVALATFYLRKGRPEDAEAIVEELGRHHPTAAMLSALRRAVRDGGDTSASDGPD